MHFGFRDQHRPAHAGKITAYSYLRVAHVRVREQDCEVNVFWPWVVIWRSGRAPLARQHWAPHLHVWMSNGNLKAARDARAREKSVYTEVADLQAVLQRRDGESR